MVQCPTRLRRFSDRAAGNDAARIVSVVVAGERGAPDVGGEAVSRGKIYEVKAIRALLGPRVSTSVAWIKDHIGQNPRHRRKEKPTGRADVVQERACESGHKPSPEDQPDSSAYDMVVAQLRTARWTVAFLSLIRNSCQAILTDNRLKRCRQNPEGGIVPGLPGAGLAFGH